MGNARLIVAFAALAVALPCAAAPWKLVAKHSEGELLVDTGSIKRVNGEVVFDYRIDYLKPQQEIGTRNQYRSTITRAIVRCGARTLAIGPTLAYAGKGATGQMIGRQPPSPEEARFQPVEPRSSDERLWHHVCSVAQLTPQS